MYIERMMKQAEYLKKGDKIAIVAPAGKVVHEKLLAGRKLLESWGYKVQLGEHALGSYNRFAGTDEERLTDLQAAFDDPEVKAVICARGGYGVSRLIDRLNWIQFKDHPKWVVGFSDITALLSDIQRHGFACIHGPMGALVAQDGGDVAAAHLKALMAGENWSVKVPGHLANRAGEVNAAVTGGNLSVLCHILGTPSFPETKGKILFIEEIDEYLYNIDRMMVQLKRAGVLKDLAGLIVGQMTGIKDDEDSFGKQVHEIVREHTGAYDFPVAFNFPAGHEAENYALPFGTSLRFKVDTKENLVTLSDH